LPVPRYYFHLRNDMDADDEEGQDLPDLETARERAVQYALEMTAVSVKETRKINLHHRIEVADEAGAILCAVEFGDVLRIEGLEPMRSQERPLQGWPRGDRDQEERS
jgi:hypothetical protein